MMRPDAPPELVALLDDPPRLAALTLESGWPLAGFRVQCDVVKRLELEGARIYATDFEIGRIDQLALRDVELSDVTIQGCDIRSLQLDRVRVSGGGFTSCRVAAGGVSDVQLTQVVLQDVACEGTAFVAIGLESSRSVGLQLTRCTCDGLVVRGVESEGGVGEACVVERAEVSDARLASGRWTGSSLRDLALDGVHLVSIDLIETDLDGVHVSNGTMRGIRGRGGSVERAVLSSNPELFDVALGGAQLNDIHVIDVAACDGLSMSRSHVAALRIEKSGVSDLSFRESEVEGPLTIARSQLDGLDLKGATVARLHMSGGSLAGAVDVSDARIAAWELEGTTVLDTLVVIGRATHNGASDPRLQGER